jgi:hypothetical protein
VTIARNAGAACDVQHISPTHQLPACWARVFEPFPRCRRRSSNAPFARFER